MTSEIKKRIADINSGKVPEGYKKTKVGIVPEGWEEIRFSDLVTEKKNTTSDFEKYPLYSLTIEEGVVPKSERYERSHLVKKDDIFKIVSENDFVYNPMNVRFGALARYKGKIDVSVSGYYDIFSVNEDNSKEYMENYLLSEPMINYYNRVSTGSLKEKQRVHFSQFLEFILPFPPLPEQQKIAEILSTQDKLIELQEKKIEHLKKLKKAYLQKMFPKKGSRYPEIRFKGFTDHWEQRELRTAATFSKGSGYSKNDLRESGTPIILYGRLYTKYETVINDVDTYVEETPNSVYSTGHEVIVPASGETAEDISRASFVAKSGILLGGDLNIITPADYINPVFLALTISNGNQQKELSKRAQGKSVVHIHNSDLENVVLLYPTYEEQEKIGEYFSKLDTLITLHQCKLEQEKQKKKALMQLLLTGKVRVKI